MAMPVLGPRKKGETSRRQRAILTSLIILMNSSPTKIKEEINKEEKN
jgi:hypothetical protein